ncbi:MAG: excinuclease ABC subunit UvrA [Steroidobacteraceae bacterium]
MHYIRIRGARTHNLKSLDLDLPRDRLIVLTGLSGSGKSSLAFDTLYAEGQRRYVESLSAYARQFLSMMDKPEVDSIEGLSPAIAIEQKAAAHNPRSTVGTVTEIFDYLRLLFARAGTPRCPDHGIDLAAQTVSQMVDQLLELPAGTAVALLAPLVSERKGEHAEVISQVARRGFVRLRIDGRIRELDPLDPPRLDPRRHHSIEAVVDRLRIQPDAAGRCAESLETALGLAGGLARLAFLDPPPREELVFSSRHACPVCGYSVPPLEPKLFSFNSPAGACPACGGLGCSVCEGTRLNRTARFVFVAGRSLPQIARLDVARALEFLRELTLPGHRGEIAARIVKDAAARLKFLVDVGLDYLTLDRSAETLSGGEAERIRLASQIGSGLTGVMYVLDEPSIGLHPRDNRRLLDTLVALRDLGNTVIVVEHDAETMLAADYLVDLGPGAGVRGGTVVAAGSPGEVMAHPASLTGQYLSGRRSIPLPRARAAPDPRKVIRISRAHGNNLRDVTVAFPIGLITCVTGVSGSGKSTLVLDTLFEHAASAVSGAEPAGAPCERIDGLEHIDRVIDVDQAPIGRTPRSNPATYTGILTPLRELFAAVPESRARGYGPSRFSFNVQGGRCEACQGDGVIKVEMHFLPDLYVPCDVCKGQRYNRETLEIRYKGRNIHEVLGMTVEDARRLFQNVPAIAGKLETLAEVGLAYLELGQSATTLSGGEAQRIKLARELAKRTTGRTLYILDEPTTGLHFHDIAQLLEVLVRLRGEGNTIVVIEHNVDVIKSADWVIDLGPEGGPGGGRLVASGTPEQVAKSVESYTGRYLKPLLGSGRAPRPDSST